MSEKIHHTNANDINDADDTNDLRAAAEALLSGDNLSEDADVMGSGEKQRILNRGRSLLSFINLGAPDIIVNREKEIFKKVAYDTDYSFAREELSRLPIGAKKIQNELFNVLARNSYDENGKDDSTFINSVVPTKRDLSSAEIMLRALLGKSASSTEYDYITNLTKKDSNGEYILSDETFSTFVEWYHHQITRLEKELTHEAESYESEFVDGVKKAVESGYLPYSLIENIERIDSKSPNYQKPQYAIADHSSLERIKFSGSCTTSVVKDSSNIITFKLDECYESSLNEAVLFHEYTHYISGNCILFGYDIEASRILNEAITETLSRAALEALYNTDENNDEEPYEFGDGKTYKNERAVLKYLQSGGQTEIDPQMFFEAYAEEDDRIMHAYEHGSDFEEWCNARSLAEDPEYHYDVDISEFTGKLDKELRKYIIEKQLYGPKTKALYEALYQAFPECKTPADLGELIIGKFSTFEEMDNKDDDGDDS